MPELPEVETMRRGIEPIIGRRIDAVHFARCRLKPITITPSRTAFRRRVTGRQIQSTERRGKRVVIRLSDCQSIVIEPRMTGLVLLTDPPDEEHLRVGLKIDHDSAPWLWFWDRRGLGTIHLLTDDQLLSRLGPDRLGPDALHVDAGDLQARMKRSRREIKVALLDQSTVAGIGNLYASEILHVAGVHPEQRCNRLTRVQWQLIHQATREVLSEAIRYEGSTLSDGTYRNALNKSGSYQNHHRVYDRKGEPCNSCESGRIRRIVQAQRSTFYCPQCQTRRPRPGRRTARSPATQA
jgi:formamidopyrimidine-DNA glycosylase